MRSRLVVVLLKFIPGSVEAQNFLPECSWLSHSLEKLLFLPIGQKALKVLYIASIALLCLAKAEAESSTQGQIVDAMSVEGDETVLCSFYNYRGKINLIYSRIDGKKLLGKQFWTAASVKKNIFSTNQSIKNFKSQLKRLSNKKTAKKLKTANATLASLKKAKEHIAQCNTKRKLDSHSSPIKFGHVKGIIETQCMQCHAVLGWKNEESYFLSSGKVIANDLEKSSFYSFLSNNPEGYQPAYMPKGSAPLSDLNLLLLSRWILNLSDSSKPTDPPQSSDPPAKDEPPSSAPESAGRKLYSDFCASCHSAIDSSAKWGRTEAQIKAALAAGGIPQMRYLNLTTEQIKEIALALSKVNPPLEGTLQVRNISSVLEGTLPAEPHSIQFEVVFSGFASKPFSVGYVTTNGTALSASDYVFSSGKLDFEGKNGERRIVNVPIIPDSFEESDETIFIDIGGVSYGGVRIANSTASGTIINDDVFAQYLPPLVGQVRMAYGFNGDYRDILRLSDALPQSDTIISSSAKVGSGALELDEGPDHVLVPGQNLQTSKNFTFAAWVNWLNSNATTVRIFDFGSSSTRGLFFSPRDSSNRCRFELRGPTGFFAIQCNTGVTLPANSWVHLAVSYNAANGEMKIYFDGQQVASRIMTAVSLASIPLTDNRLGKSRETGSVDFNGKLDEVIVWDAVLSASEISQVYAMDQTSSVNSGIEVRLKGQPIANGSVLNLGSVAIGEELNQNLVISNTGLAGLSLLGTPKVEILGSNPNEIKIQYQPWPWQGLLGTGSFSVFSLRFTPLVPGDKSATLVVSNSDMRNGNFALALTARATGEPLPEPPAPAQENPALLQGQTLYTINCASCHGLLSRSQKLGVTLPRLTNALNSTTGVTQMRGLGLTSEQIERIVLALNSPVPSPSTEVEKVRNSTVIIGTGPFVASVFSNIFLPEDTSTFTTDDNLIKAKINENILGVRADGNFVEGHISFFGGRCNHFDPVCQSEATALTQQPPANTVRTGFVNKTCDEILSIDKAVDNALAKIQRLPSSAVDPQAPQEIYELFFPGRELPLYLSEVISNFTQGASGFSSRDNWRFSLSLICLSNDWEAL